MTAQIAIPVWVYCLLVACVLLALLIGAYISYGWGYDHAVEEHAYDGVAPAARPVGRPAAGKRAAPRHAATAPQPVLAPLPDEPAAELTWGALVGALGADAPGDAERALLYGGQPTRPQPASEWESTATGEIARITAEMDVWLDAHVYNIDPTDYGAEWPAGRPAVQALQEQQRGWMVRAEVSEPVPVAAYSPASSPHAQGHQCPRCGNDRWATLQKGRCWQCRICAYVREVTDYLP